MNPVTNSRPRGFLLKNLSCVEVNDKIIAFSPYSGKMWAAPAGSEKDILAAGEMFRPLIARQGKRQVSFICTTDCLQRCVYCFNRGGQGNALLPTETAIGVLREVTKIDNSPLSLRFFGGEPTMHMKLVRECAGWVKDRGIEPSFSITTGGYAALKDMEWMASEGFFFTLSVDGPPEIQARQRPLFAEQGSGLIEPEETLKLLSAWGADFKVRVTVTSQNVHMLPDLVSYFHGFGTKVIHMEPVTLSGRATALESLRPEEDLFIEKLLAAIDRAASLGVIIINSSYMKLLDSDSGYCECGINNFVVGTDGRISFCYESAGDCGTLSEEMKGGRYNEATGKLELSGPGRCGGDSLPAECAGCYAKFVCNGGCPSRNIADRGDALKSSGYFCRLTRAIYPEIVARLAREAGLTQ
ncbi:MAG: SPASM domain-containing protein [Deltaproteobacteria bacterium]|nr:SPASM domain-containing protein [Deltaproteobacteria bacterium]